MIHIRLNDELISLDNSCSLAEVLTQQNYPANHFAIAVNRHFIPRGQYATTLLNEGDVVELVSPMQGG